VISLPLAASIAAIVSAVVALVSLFVSLHTRSRVKKTEIEISKIRGGNYSVGGLVGSNYGGSIVNSYAKGNVSLKVKREAGSNETKGKDNQG